MNGTVQFNGSSSAPFDISSSIKLDCVLYSAVGKCIRHELKGPTCVTGQTTRSSTSPIRLRDYVRIRDMLFADAAAVATHTQQELQSSMDCFSQACNDFRLTISLNKANLVGQDTEPPPVITIDYTNSMLSGKTKCPTMMMCLVLTFPVCIFCLGNTYCDDWFMSAVLRRVVSQNTSSSVSCH